MRVSRLLLLTVAAVSTLAATAVATAARPTVEDGTLSVRDGRGTIVLRMRGGVIGRFARGKLTVTEPEGGASTVIVRGEEDSFERNERTTVYTGNNIRYRIASERRIVVKLEATKINFSAVGRGEVFLDGRGNPENGVFFDGSYSLNGDAYRSLPDERFRVELEAAPAAESG
jgi:hypothetical protein